MKKTFAVFTVFFEDPFWVGVYERQCGQHHAAAKVVFGAQPKDSEVLGFLLKNWHQLTFSPSLRGEEISEKRRSPKRVQREIRRCLQDRGVGTKAQQALQKYREEHKLEKRKSTKERRQQEKDRAFVLRQEKRREKKKGH